MDMSPLQNLSFQVNVTQDDKPSNQQMSKALFLQTSVKPNLGVMRNLKDKGTLRGGKARLYGLVQGKTREWVVAAANPPTASASGN